MAFYAKLATFFILLGALVWYLWRRPTGMLARVAFSWWGPIPQIGEHRSRLMFRWCLYSLGWLVQVSLIISLGFAAKAWRPGLKDVSAFMAVWGFGLWLGAGMALFGALLAGLSGLKAKLLGPDPEFVAPSPASGE